MGQRIARDEAKRAWTIAQDESSCVVYGMPRVAVELGATREILTPEQIITRLQLLRPKMDEE